MELNNLCQIVLIFATVLAVSVAPPPPGFYTFDGRKLHPIGRPVQRRSGNEPSFVSGWKLPTFSKPSFLAALTEQREDDDDDEQGGLPTVSAAHLLPDYLTHQEFLKPQLQAAGFSGGRIIAGPFPVPLAALPKPPPRSGANGPISSAPVTGGASAPVALAPPPSPTEAKHAPSAGRPYKPVQFPAVASQPIPIVKKPINKSPPPLSPPPPPPTTTTPQPVTLQTSRLTYPLPPSSVAASAPAPWYAAHQSGPERLTSSLGQASYNAAATHPQEGTRVTYGGWTPIYSASYANVQQQQYPASSDFTDGVQREPFLQDVVPQQHVTQAEQELEPLPSSQPIVTSSSDSQVVGEADIPSSLSTLTQEEETSSIKKRTVRKRKSKQVSSSSSPHRRRSSSLKRRADQQQQKPVEEQAASPAASNKDNAEVADLSTSPASSSSFTSISSPVSDVEAPIVVVVAESSKPLVSTARGQGRFIGRVLPATVFDEDDLNHMMIRLPTSRFHQPIDPYY